MKYFLYIFTYPVSYTHLREKTFQSLSKPTINLDIDQKYPGFFTKESFNDCTEEDLSLIHI